jgi:hypothetical protein
VLFGILNNCNERDWFKSGGGRCPVLWSSPGAIVIVMPRASILTDDDFRRFCPHTFCVKYGIRAEHKPDSYGWIGGKIYAVDYGW